MAKPTATYRVRFPAGHTLSDVAVWYAGLTCRRVILSRKLSTVAIPIQIDALVEGNEIDSMLTSMLHDIGLVAVRRGRGVFIRRRGDSSGKLPRASDRLVLAPAPAGQGQPNAPAAAGQGQRTAPAPAGQRADAAPRSAQGASR